ncbi:MAG: hypothetical protein HYV34_02250 [Candidatus Kerfeldbacteria bacterium]|nr:hypothetical protein [Candidatus Kerfeldbacteria bacterium]
MADINLLGHEENGKHEKSSRRYSELLTDPSQQHVSQPSAAKEGIATLVRELAERTRKNGHKRAPAMVVVKAQPPRPSPQPLPKRERPSTPLQQMMRGERPAPPTPRAPLRPVMTAPIPSRPVAPDLALATPAAPRGKKISPPRTKTGLEWTNPQSPNGGGIDVNLIPSKQGSPFEPVERTRRVGAILAVNLLLVILAYFGLLLYEASLIRETQTIDAELTGLQSDIATYAQTKKTAVDVTRQISGIAYLLDHHTEWTNVFDILEDYTLPTVYYESMTVDVGGKMTMTAIAPDMKAVVDQLRVFRLYPEIFTSVDVTETKAIQVAVAEEEGTGEEQAPAQGAEAGAEEVTIPKISFGLELSLNPDRITEYTP